jgi:hypothetical protein
MVSDQSVTVFMFIKTEYIPSPGNEGSGSPVDIDDANIKITLVIQKKVNEVIDKYQCGIELRGAIIEFADDSIVECDDGSIVESDDDSFDMVLSLTADNEDAIDAIAEEVCTIDFETNSTAKVTKVTKAKKKKLEDIGFQDLP